MTQKEALEILKMGENVFLTGAAGSGKTHTLRSFISYLKENNVGVAVTASTGIAATHLDGTTIHAWSGLGIRDSLSEFDIDMLESRKYLWDRYQNTKVLIIDEISMLHHFRFDLLDKLARSFKRNDAPFGGMQIVLCGDFFQLPPISRPSEPEAYFAFRSKVWNEMNLKVCYLTEQHRQNDEFFLSVLSAIREDRVDEEVISFLKSATKKNDPSSFCETKLSSHNVDVDQINNFELSKIIGVEKKFQMTSHGKSNIVENLKKGCLAPENLVLKIGARVMFVKNSFEKKYANGTLGIVEGYSTSGFPLVKTAKGLLVEALPQSFVIEEDGKIKAEITQVPLRLAWAITVHKSQGMSLDFAEIDLSRSFVDGMGYVALSRVKNISGLKLVGFNAKALQVNPEVLEIDRVFRQKSRDAETSLEYLGVKDVKNKQEEFLNKNSSARKVKEQKLTTEEKTKSLIDQKLPLDKIAKARGLKEDSIISHIEKLLEENIEMDIEYLKKEMVSKVTEKRFKKIKEAFKKSHSLEGDLRLAPVKKMLGDEFSYNEIRFARLFLNI